MSNIIGKKPTYWYSVKYGNIRPKSRYVILFSLKGQYDIRACSRTETNDINECYDECDEINRMYGTHQIPIEAEKREITVFGGHYRKPKRQLQIVYDYSGNRSWWGYIVLDMQECKAIRVGGYGFNMTMHKCYATCKSINNFPEERDYFFRDVDKVPDNYEFDAGEYEGWLQFRWGDGKNAIGYVNKQKTYKEKQKDEQIDNVTNEDYENDIIENKFADMIDEETRKRLINICK